MLLRALVRRCSAHELHLKGRRPPLLGPGAAPVTSLEALAAVTEFLEGSEGLQKPSALASELETLGPERSEATRGH